MGTPTPHDTWFHFTHRHPRHAATWLRSCLPVALVDWNTLRLCSERVHGLALRLGFTDLAYEVRLRGTKLRVFVLIEHRSFRDPRLHDQVLRYSVHLTHSQRRRPTSPPTPVIAVVLYHGEGSFDLRPSLPRGIAKLDPAAASLFESLQPRLHCITDDLGAFTEAGLIARDLTPLCTLNHLSLRFLPHSTRTETLAALDRWGPILRAVDTDEGPPIGHEAIAKFGWYLLQVTETPVEDVEDVHVALEKHLHRTEETFMSTAEKLRREGLQQGLTQGRAETLIRLFNRRFGPLPPAVETRLRSATTAELDRWTDRILDSTTIDAVFAED